MKIETRYQDINAKTEIRSYRGSGLCRTGIREYVYLHIGDTTLLIDTDQIKRVRKALNTKTLKVKEF